jgi:hypothetical protein
MLIKNKFYFCLLISLILSIFVSWINLYNKHGDIVYFNNLYNSLADVPFQVFFGTNSQGLSEHQYSGEFLLKLILWISSNLLVPKIIFDFIIYYLFFICLIYIIVLKKINILLAIFCLCSSYYIWNIIFCSIKNLIALNLFFLSVIYYLKNKKYFFIFFYSVCICVASGYIILYLFLFIISLDNKKFLLKEKTTLTIILLSLPIFFSYQLMLSRLTGYNVIKQKDPYTTQQAVTQQSFYDKNNYLKKKLHSIKKALDHDYKISLFKISLHYPKYSIDWNEKNLSLNYKILHILKIIFFVFLIYLFKHKKTHFLFFSSSVFFISGLIAFEKITLFLYLIFLTTLLVNYQKNNKYSKIKIFTFFVFNLYLLSKQFVMIYNLYFYNAPYQY